MKAIVKPFTEEIKTKEILPDILYYIDQVYDENVVLIGIIEGEKKKKKFLVNKNRIVKMIRD